MEIRPAFLLILFLMLLPSAVARDGEGMRVVPAQEILDKIERGVPVEYDHVIVEGDLDLGKVDLPKIKMERTSDEIIRLESDENASEVSSSIWMNDCTIDGNISFANAIFGNSVDFTNSYFNGTAYFVGSAFKGDACFKGSDFNNNANFWHSDFNGTANFLDSAFNGFALFGGSAFKGDADFVRSAFKSIAEFKNIAFKGDAYFSYSDFNGGANFYGSTFNGYAYFWGSDFNNNANFEDSDFNSYTYFGRSTFNSHTYFGRSTFNGYADFGGSDFNNDANFEDSDFNSYTYFGRSTFNSYADFEGSDFNNEANFWHSDFNISDFSSSEFNKAVSFNDANFSNSTTFNDSRFKEDALFEGAVFDGPLYLTRAKYDRLYIRWMDIRELGYYDAAYLALLENFKKLGYVEDYDACYYEYRRLHRDQPWSGKYHALSPGEEWLRKRIDLGLQAFYGYGKKPLLPLLWSIGTILLFGLIWRKAGVDGGKGRGGIFERYGQGGAQSRKLSLEEQLRALFGAMLFSATLFLSGTRLFVDPPALPALEGWFAAHARGFFIAERVLGAFFSILFFLAVSGTVVR